MNNAIIELADDQIDLVGGGVNWGDIVGGGFGLAITLAAIATAPETAGTSLLLLGAVTGGAGSGALIGAGLR